MTSRDDASTGAADPQRIGWFRYYFDDDRWEWSPEVQQMHGYTAGTVTPTTRLVQAHKHPRDNHQIVDTLELVRRTRRPLRSRHRICDTHGNMRHIAVLGDPMCDEDGRVVGIYGFYVDLTEEQDTQAERLTAELVTVSERRSMIEQVKGMLMLAYGLDEPAAFDLLVWRSQQTNVKLRDLAEQILKDFSAVSDDGAGLMSTWDQLLLTAHERIQNRE